MKFLNVYSWKPSSGINFGDEIGPSIIQKLSDLNGLDISINPVSNTADPKLLCVGSILQEAREGDVVWGAGVNGKVIPKQIKNLKDITFLSVRGPITREIVRSMGKFCPEVYGDPGLIYPFLHNEEIRREQAVLLEKFKRLGTTMPKVVFIPNINDERFIPDYIKGLDYSGVYYLSPRMEATTIAAYISSADLVLSSSLHGLVFADALGVPSVRMRSLFEPELKYVDYYEGTGRTLPCMYDNVSDAMNSDSIPFHKNWDPLKLITSFPLFTKDNLERLVLKKFVIKPNVDYHIDEETSAVLKSGWSQPINGSSWSVTNPAIFSFVVDKNIGSASTLRVRVGTLVEGNTHYEKIRVLRNGSMVGSFIVIRNEGSLDIDIPIGRVRKGEEVSLVLKSENPSIPADFGNSEDRRELGFWISGFMLQG